MARSSPVALSLRLLLPAALAAAGPSGEPRVGADGVRVVVQTKEGPVVGRINGSEPTRDCFGQHSVPGVTDVAAFYGVPFAAPPVGELRWRPPRPAHVRTAAIDAVSPGPVCPQAPLDQLAEWLPQWTPGWSFDEDCLTLNIWSPSLGANGEASSLEPVVVFIHGGGFAGGNGYTQTGCPFYNGMPIAASEKLVVVTLKYRLGFLGFLSLPELQAEEGTSGNYGLQDQRLALQWVQQNIAAFGGDPRRVTVMGESAGASSVLYHTVLPRSAGLFAQGIVQSGYDLTKQPHGQGPMSALQLGRTLQGSLGCALNSAEASLACLRNASARDIITAQDSYLKGRSLVDLEVSFAPVADGFEMPVGSNLVAEMRLRPPRIPLLIGGNMNETSLFLCASLGGSMSAAEAAKEAQDLAPKLGVNFTAPELERAMSLYPVGTGAGAYPSHRSAVIGLSTDLMFTCVVQAAADIASVIPGSRVYRYVLARSPRFFRVSSCLGVPHIVDTFYNFLGNGLPGLVLSALYDEGDRAVIELMATAWWSFARSGAPALPAGAAVGDWPRYDGASKAMLRIDAEASVEHGQDAGQCAALPPSGRDSPTAARASALRFV